MEPANSIPPWDRPDRTFPAIGPLFCCLLWPRHSIHGRPPPPLATPARGRQYAFRPTPSEATLPPTAPIFAGAFAPDFAAPRRPLLWNGEGIGAETALATPEGPVAAARLLRGGSVLGPAGCTARLSEVHHLNLPAAAFRRLGQPAPVLLAAGALGFGLPTAPLVLGPSQRIRLGGTWLEAGRLVDGQRIVHQDGAAAMVLLATDVSLPPAGAMPLLAAGVVLAPAGAPHGMADAGAEAEILMRLADASGVPPGWLDGYVDHADRFGVTGWARDTAAPARVVPLEALVDGIVIGRALADQPRPDLARPRQGEAGSAAAAARHGFTLRFAAPLPAGRSWMVQLCRAGGRVALPGTPLLLDATATATAPARFAIALAPARFDIALAGLAAGSNATDFLARLIVGAAPARPR